MSQLLSANQIYAKAKPGKSFSDWIACEKNEYGNKINTGKIAGQMPFINWLNQKWKMKMKSADGIVGGIADIITKTGEKLGQATEQVTSPVYKPKTNTILGLKKGTFYALLGITLLVGSYSIYVYVKNKK
jgi:hypothetical protein